MAPELVSKKKYYGGPVDVWAFGVLMYRTLVGRFPFNGRTINELNN